MRALLSCLILSLPIWIFSQQTILLEDLEFPGLKEFNQKKIDINKKGMLTLGTWASSNIIAGGVMYFTTEDELQQFSLMNVLWNTINLGIAIPGYLKESKSKPSNKNVLQSYNDAHSSQKAYLINTGLDIGYITAGALLVERSKNQIKNEDLLKGFGYSFMVQGLGLLIFDVTMVSLHGKNRKRFSAKGSEILIQPTGNGIQLKF